MDEFYKATLNVLETENEFIFESIRPWAEEKTQRSITKKDLTQALVRYFNRGEWVDADRCSICGARPFYLCSIYELKFCPNCGADMRGEEHE